MKGTILLAVDHAKVSERAAELVTDLASLGGNDVLVLHVHQLAIGSWGRWDIDPEAESGCPSDIIGKKLKAAGLQVTATKIGVAVGHVGAEIVRVADRCDAALIVMGTRNESDLASMTLGSTSHRVLHLAHRPVLLVPGD